MHKTRRHRNTKHKKRFSRRKYKQKRKNTTRKGVKKRKNTRKKKHGGVLAEAAHAGVKAKVEAAAAAEEAVKAKKKEVEWWKDENTKNAIDILNNIAPIDAAAAAAAAAAAPPPPPRIDDKFTINIVPSLREHGKGAPLGTKCDPGSVFARDWKHNSKDDILYEANNCAGYITDGAVVKAQRNISTVDSQVEWITRMNGDDERENNYLATKPRLSHIRFELKIRMPMPKTNQAATIRSHLLYEVVSSKEDNFIFVGHHNNMKDALFPDLGKKIALGNCCCIEVKLTVTESERQKLEVEAAAAREKAHEEAAAREAAEQAFAAAENWSGSVEIKVIYSGETDKYSNLLGDTEDSDIIGKLTKTWTDSLNEITWNLGPMTKKLYFIRHGQTLHNLAAGEKCINYRQIKKAKFIDNPLTYKGQLQAVKCCVKLHNSTVFNGFTKENTKLYTSILTRTTDTLFLIL